MRVPLLRLLAVLITFCTLPPVPERASAQTPDSTRIRELERQMEAVTRELERLALGGDVVEADESVLGFGPAASKVYRVSSGVSVGGYGEVLYESFARDRQDGTPAGAPDRFDALRAIVYVGYKFDDRLLFNSEIEIEHADEAFLEFAYVDYMLDASVGVRGGLLLVPMGLVNELHEPPVYLGTERPLTEQRIIPTTWRANGVGLFGSGGELAWRAYVVNALDGQGFSSDGLRGGRQKGSRALADDLAFTGRLDWIGRPGLVVGASAYVGETGHDREGTDGPVDGRVLVWDVHADYEVAGFDLRALVAGAKVDDVEELNGLAGLGGAEGIGSSMLGWYVEAGYDLLAGSGSRHAMIPYVRHERVDTQREVGSGFARDPATDATVTSLGVAWKPAPQVVAKLGYQIHADAGDTGVNQLNFQLGWLF